jgi:peptide-methionine (S)-S-oxide reductase
MGQAQHQSNQQEGMETATLGGGCFWCLEAVFDELQGVKAVEPGYSGGSVPNPSYQQVCTDKTGHAEVVQVTFDPKEISFRDILEAFFTFHDPTTLNRQGADVGARYRSVIFYHSPEQKATAEQLIKELESEKVWPGRIVTQVVPFEAFYMAEDYHQEYYRLNSQQPYCQIVIAPKMAKLRQLYQKRLKV